MVSRTIRCRYFAILFADSELHDQTSPTTLVPPGLTCFECNLSKLQFPSPSCLFQGIKSSSVLIDSPSSLFPLVLTSRGHVRRCLCKYLGFYVLPATCSLHDVNPHVMLISEIDVSVNFFSLLNGMKMNEIRALKYERYVGSRYRHAVETCIIVVCMWI